MQCDLENPTDICCYNKIWNMFNELCRRRRGGGEGGEINS